MAKIILTLNDVLLRELTLQKKHITIGRHTDNDIVLNDAAISSEHAVIVTVNGDSILEDLNSTNGTQVNGQPVKKHFLQDRDVVELAPYRLHYFAELEHDGEAPNNPSALHGLQQAAPRAGIAVIRVLNGPNAGKEVKLAKPLTTIGQAGGQVAVIARSSEGYSLDHIDGDNPPILNGSGMGTGACLLKDGDVINLDGVAMEFSFGQQVRL